MNLVGIDEDFSDDKSDVSALTNKTSKSTRGKHADKHCLICKKVISGKNWRVHVKKVHNGETPTFKKRAMVDPNQGKFLGFLLGGQRAYFSRLLGGQKFF